MTRGRERNGVPRYTLTAIALHWLSALLIVAAFVLGMTMVDIPGTTPTKLKYFSWHKWLGVTVFALACLRLLWRLGHRPPPDPASMPAWQRGAAHAVHWALYGLVFAVPLSGYFYSLAAGVPVVYLGVLPLPVLIAPDPQLKETLQGVHYALNMAMAALVVVHLAAVIKHQWIDRDRLLARMLP